GGTRGGRPGPSARGRPERAPPGGERRAAPPLRRRGVGIVGGVGVLVGIGVAARRFGGGTAAVEVVAPTVVRAGTPEAAGLPLLFGARYVVSGDRDIALGVTVPGRVDRHLLEEGDHLEARGTPGQLDPPEYRAT